VAPGRFPRTVRTNAGASGTLTSEIVYTAFGQPVSQIPPCTTQRFLFAGREFSPSLGEYYYRARSYDPTTGRFQSGDPMRFRAGDANLYRFVRNAPTNYVDPTGKATLIEYAVAFSGSIVTGVAATLMTKFVTTLCFPNASLANRDLLVYATNRLVSAMGATTTVFLVGSAGVEVGIAGAFLLGAFAAPILVLTGVAVVGTSCALYRGSPRALRQVEARHRVSKVLEVHRPVKVRRRALNLPEGAKMGGTSFRCLAFVATLCIRGDSVVHLFENTAET